MFRSRLKQTVRIRYDPLLNKKGLNRLNYLICVTVLSKVEKKLVLLLKPSWIVEILPGYSLKF